MAWRCSGTTNAELIANLAESGLIQSERVRRGMLGVDRAHYAPSSPYEDSPQSIGFSATISAPHMHASAAESLLDFLTPSSSVLDVGSGSGYLTHVLANLVVGSSSSHTPTTTPASADANDKPVPLGKVIGIDHIPNLVHLATTNMSKSATGRALLRDGHVKFVQGDGRKGWADEGPYDAIHVGAAATETHEELVEQLRRPGRMFIPVVVGGDSGRGGGSDGQGEQFIWVVDKGVDGKVVRKRIMGVRYVPLTDAPG